jgi:hypothetical protein
MDNDEDDVGNLLGGGKSSRIMADASEVDTLVNSWISFVVVLLFYRLTRNII